MTTDSRRQYPRLPVKIPAVLEVRPAALKSAKQELSSVITTLSFDGAGFQIESPESVSLQQGQPTSFDLVLGGRTISIRSQIAWYGADPMGRVLVGLRLLLPLCSRDARCAYSEWIVGSYYGSRTAAELAF